MAVLRVPTKMTTILNPMMNEHSVAAEELEGKVKQLYIDITRLNDERKKRTDFCRELFYTDKNSEEVKQELAKKAYYIKPVTQWAYENSSDQKLLRRMTAYAPVKLYLIPFIIRNTSLEWVTIERMLYLHSKTQERAKIRQRLLEKLPDSYYTLYAKEFVHLMSNNRYQQYFDYSIVTERVKKVLDLEDAPDEWLFSMFTNAA